MSDQTIPTALGKRRSRLGQLEDKIGLPATFALTSATIGLISGLGTGGITAVMTNLVETPQARPHILRVTPLAGLVHGMVGAGLIAVKGHDDLPTRAVSGCVAGLSIGMSQGKVGLACGMCVGLAGLSMFERASSAILRMDDIASQPRTGQAMFTPHPTTSEKWIDSWLKRCRETK